MTVQQMHVAFKIGLDKIDSLNYPNFTANEIDFLLNQAQERFVKQRYGLNNISRKPIESDQKRTDDLRALITNSVLQFEQYDPTENIDVNARFVKLPDNYWFAINERCTISYSDCKSSSKEDVVWVRTINHDEFSMVINNPFEGPNKDKVLRLMFGNNMEIIKHKDVDLVNYQLRYIRKPVSINLQNNVSCELADHTHSEIVNEAIMIGLESIESNRTQSFVAVNKNKEE